MAVAKKGKVLQPVHPNAGLEMMFRKKLTSLIEDMHNSVIYWLGAAYKRNEPLIAQDETPAGLLRKLIRRMVRRWQKRFNDMAPELADYFSQSVRDRLDAALKSILKKGGLAVEFKMTGPMRDVMNATIGEQVSLIKSIPAQYLGKVEGIVMRGVQTGRDLGQISKDLHEQLGVTKRRAAFIARDQSNKATASMSRVRQIEIAGPEAEAVWVHSGGGKHPRPTHQKAGKDKTRYKVREGWYDPVEKKHIFPGELVNCRCVAGLYVPGFS